MHDRQPYPGCALLHDFYLARARSDPDLIALSWHGDEAGDGLDVSYAQLRDLALILAAELVHIDQAVIPICLPKSIEMVVAMLAVLLVGKAYCNMEPDLPLERKKDMLEEVVTVDRDDKVARPTVLGQIQGDFRCIDPTRTLHPALAALRSHRPIDAPSLGESDLMRPPAEAPAYVIYTSGSTGKPKGIVISHSNVAAFLRNYQGVFDRVKADDPRGCRVLQFASYAFDVMVMNIWDTFAVSNSRLDLLGGQTEVRNSTEGHSV